MANQQTIVKRVIVGVPIRNVTSGAYDLSLSADSGSDVITLASETLTIAGGVGISTGTSITSNLLTIHGDYATTASVGVASFDSDQFTVNSFGAVSTTTIDGGTF